MGRTTDIRIDLTDADLERAADAAEQAAADQQAAYAADVDRVQEESDWMWLAFGPGAPDCGMCGWKKCRDCGDPWEHDPGSFYEEIDAQWAQAPHLLRVAAGT